MPSGSKLSYVFCTVSIIVVWDKKYIVGREISSKLSDTHDIHNELKPSRIVWTLYEKPEINYKLHVSQTVSMIYVKCDS